MALARHLVKHQKSEWTFWHSKPPLTGDAPVPKFRAYQPKECKVDQKLWDTENEKQERIRSENLPNLVSLQAQADLLSRMHLTPPADACRMSDIEDGNKIDVPSDEEPDQYDHVEEIVCSFTFLLSVSVHFLFFDNKWPTLANLTFLTPFIFYWSIFNSSAIHSLNIFRSMILQIKLKKMVAAAVEAKQKQSLFLFTITFINDPHTMAIILSNEKRGRNRHIM